MCEHEPAFTHQIVLPLPKWCATGKQNRSVCVDKCIVKVIKLLWKNKIETLGCCCGHNKMRPNIVISDGYTDIASIKKLIKTIDKREWIIYQWKLTEV